jgi:hypothetical protein
MLSILLMFVELYLYFILWMLFGYIYYCYLLSPLFPYREKRVWEVYHKQFVEHETHEK